MASDDGTVETSTASSVANGGSASTKSGPSGGDYGEFAEIAEATRTVLQPFANAEIEKARQETERTRIFTDLEREGMRWHFAIALVVFAVAVIFAATGQISAGALFSSTLGFGAGWGVARGTS